MAGEQAQPVNLVKGRFVQRSTGIVTPFMFNPTQITGAHGWTRGSKPIPGRSHPHRSGGHGNEEQWNLSLYHDGDRGRVGTRPRFEGDIPINPFIPNVGLDVMPEVNVLRSFVLPNDPDLGEAYGIPDTYFLTIGSAIRAEVEVDEVEWSLDYFTPKLEVVRAVADVRLTVVKLYNTTNWIFINEQVSNALTEDPEVIPGGNP